MKPEQEFQKLINYQKAINEILSTKSETWVQEISREHIAYIKHAINQSINEYKQNKLPIKDIYSINQITQSYLDSYRHAVESIMNFDEYEAQLEYENTTRFFEEFEFCAVTLEVSGIFVKDKKKEN